MKVLITGGAGFVGSTFIRHLLGRPSDIEVTNLDRLTYAGNLENLQSVTHLPSYHFVHGDIADPEVVDDCLAAGVDAIVNFAAESHVDRSILDSTAFSRTNIEGTRVLLDGARRHRVQRFLQISTDEVYGSLGEDEGRFTEESPLLPNSPYAASKAAADLLVRSYHQTYGLHTIVTRCSNNYGPRQFPEKLIPLVILNTLEDRPLPIYGDGLNRRDWIHVSDHCQALEQVLIQGRSGTTYNIGGDCELTNLEVVHSILDLLEKPTELIRFVEDRPAHDRRYAVDASLIRGELNWSPQVDFRSGLAATIEWFQRNEAWVGNVRSRRYRDYYQRMYDRRSQTLGRLGLPNRSRRRK